jgi:hypothetical protein
MIKIEEKYILLAFKGESDIIGFLDASEKQIITTYRQRGVGSFIFDLTGFEEIQESILRFIQKVGKVAERESGIIVVVAKSLDIKDQVEDLDSEYTIFLPTVDEAVEAVFMNDLENEFKDGEEESFFGGDE